MRLKLSGQLESEDLPGVCLSCPTTPLGLDGHDRLHCPDSGLAKASQESHKFPQLSGDLALLASPCQLFPGHLLARALSTFLRRVLNLSLALGNALLPPPSSLSLRISCPPSPVLPPVQHHPLHRTPASGTLNPSGSPSSCLP